MKKLLTLFSLILMGSFLFSYNVTEYKNNSEILDYNWQILNQSGFTLKWRTTTDNHLEVILSAQTTGWVAVGFGATSAMANANIIIGYIQNNTVNIRDDYGVSQTSHSSDISLGGQDNLQNTSGSEENGITTIQFKIPLNSNDQYDKVLTPNQSMSIILAKGANNSDNYTSMHNSAITASITIPAIPVALQFESITAQWNIGSQAVLNWSTSNESNLTGFNILRHTSEDMTNAQIINNEMIPALNGNSNSYSFTDNSAVQTQTYYYWLAAVEADGNLHYSQSVQLLPLNTIDHTNEKPVFSSIKNYPNPFNPQTSFDFTIKNDTNLKIMIYNSRGQLIREIYNGFLKSGNYRNFSWEGKDDNGREVSAGVYHLILKSSYDHAGKKLILLK